MKLFFFLHDVQSRMATWGTAREKDSTLTLAGSDLFRQIGTLNCQVRIVVLLFLMFVRVLLPAGLSSAGDKLIVTG